MQQWIDFFVHPSAPFLFAATSWVLRRQARSWPPEAVDEFVAGLPKGAANNFEGSVIACRFLYPVLAVLAVVSAVAVIANWLVG